MRPEHDFRISAQKEFVDDTWLTLLVACDVSAMINLVTSFEGTVLSFIQTLLASGAVVMLFLYSKLKVKTLSQITTELELMKLVKKEPLLVEDVIRVHSSYIQKMPFLRYRGIAVIASSAAAVVFLILSNTVKQHYNEDRSVTSQLESIASKVDSTLAGVDSMISSLRTFSLSGSGQAETSGEPAKKQSSN